MIKNKKGVNNVIGYILLVSMAVVISILVFQWLKSYIPTDEIACPDGISLFVENSVYKCYIDNLTLTIKNNGKFSVGGYYIRGTNSSTQSLAILELSSFSPQGTGGAIIFEGNENGLNPGNKINNSFSFSSASFNILKSIEIIPIRYQKVGNNDRIVSCAESRITFPLSCYNSTTSSNPICGNSITETGEQCDDGNTNNGDGCSSTCQTETPLCGNGIINSGEQCDDSNYASGDGCSSSCLIELGYSCSGTPSTCTGLGIFNATYSSLSKDTGSNPDPTNCKPSQGCHWWYFTSTLQELGGIEGITVNSRQKCYITPSLNFCDPVRTTISQFYGTDYIIAGGQISNTGNYIYTHEASVTLTETFNGTDYNLNFVSDSYTFTVTA